MNSILKLCTLIGASLILTACCCEPEPKSKYDPPFPPANNPPSEDAKDLAGAMGTMTFLPNDWTSMDSVWVDSDGVAPGVAGCHTEVGGAGRMFGEACLSDAVLVESNPGAGVEHPHKNDVGNPDIVHCNAWCQKANDAVGGVCQSVVGPDPCAASAKCVCEF